MSEPEGRDAVWTEERRERGRARIVWTGGCRECGRARVVWTEERRERSDRSDEGRRRVKAPVHRADGVRAIEHGDRSNEGRRRLKAPWRLSGNTHA